MSCFVFGGVITQCDVKAKREVSCVIFGVFVLYFNAPLPKKEEKTLVEYFNSANNVTTGTILRSTFGPVIDFVVTAKNECQTVGVLDSSLQSCCVFKFLANLGSLWLI